METLTKSPKTEWKRRVYTLSFWFKGKREPNVNDIVQVLSVVNDIFTPPKKKKLSKLLVSGAVLEDGQVPPIFHKKR
jgi:hypothetical protein